MFSAIEKQNILPPIMQSDAPAHPMNKAAPNSYLQESDTFMLHKDFNQQIGFFHPPPPILGECMCVTKINKATQLINTDSTK